MKKQLLILAIVLSGAAGAVNAAEEDGLYTIDDNRQLAPIENTSTADVLGEVNYTAYDELSDEAARTAEAAPAPGDDSDAVVPGANWPEGT